MGNSGRQFVTDAPDWLLEYVCRPGIGTRHAILIDPADQTPEVAAKRCVAAVAAGSRMVLVGGSSDTDMDNVHNTIIAIREALELVTWASSQDSTSEEAEWTVPIILFPQGAAALSPAADGITFMMLMNSTSPRFLIEEQVAGAPFIREAGVTPLPMGYLICAPGGKQDRWAKLTSFSLTTKNALNHMRWRLNHMVSACSISRQGAGPPLLWVRT